MQRVGEKALGLAERGSTQRRSKAGEGRTGKPCGGSRGEEDGEAQLCRSLELRQD